MSTGSSDASHWDYHTDDCEATKARIDGMQNWPSACNCKGRQGSSKKCSHPENRRGFDTGIEWCIDCQAIMDDKGNFVHQTAEATDAPQVLSASAECPLCGHEGPHPHTPLEQVIYHNGVKAGKAHGNETCELLRPPQRYRVQQDKGEYALKGCADGDLVDYSAYEALLRRFNQPPAQKASEHLYVPVSSGNDRCSVCGQPKGQCSALSEGDPR